MKTGRVATTFVYPILCALALVAAGSSRALAQDDHDHSRMAAAHHEQTPEQKKQASALVTAVRHATEQFQNVENAGPDYALVFGCVSGGDFGAMGMHFLNGSLLGDGDVNVNYPEILLYEPLPNGRLRLTGADYLVDIIDHLNLALVSRDGWSERYLQRTLHWRRAFASEERSLLVAP